jgi:hypothetical protein
MKSPHLIQTAVQDLKHLAEKLHVGRHVPPPPGEPPPGKTGHPLRDRVEKVILHLPPGNLPLP